MTKQDPKNTAKPAKSFSISNLLQPRYILQVWLWLGGLVLAFVFISAMWPTGTSKSNTNMPSVLIGEMADFHVNSAPNKRPFDVFIDQDGNQVSLADFDGQIRIVNIWATYCAPCLVELPSLDQLQADMPEIKVIAVAAEPTEAAKINRFWQNLKMENLDLYQDPQLRFTFKIASVDVMPVTVIYDAKDNKVGHLIGEADWAGQDAKNLINAIKSGDKIK